MAENDPQIYQRFVHGVQRHGHTLDDLERAEENARHARRIGGRLLVLLWAVLAFIAVVAALFVLYQITGVPSTSP